MFNPLHVWALGVVSLVAAIIVAVWVSERLIHVTARLSALEAEQKYNQSNYNQLHREMRSVEDRLAALERRPPVVTVTLQPPAPAPKQGKAVAK